MTRNPVAAIAAMSLGLVSATPVLAQEQRFAGFDAPRGTTATVNLRVPLGSRAGGRAERPSLGLTIGHGQPIAGSDPSGRPIVRQMRVADLRFDRDGLSRAELVTFNLANLEGDARLQLNPDENKKNVFWLALMAAAGVLAFIWATDGDGSSSSEDPPTTPPPTGT